MARHKGAVGFEIGTSKLGAYSMEDTLEIFEREGYIKYKDLDQYFKDCYFDFENKLSEKEFIEKSKKNIMRSHKYKQFLNNEVSICRTCRNVKPIDSFYDRKTGGKHSMCKKCYVKLYTKEAKINKEKSSEYQRRYYNKNKETINKKHKIWKMNNRDKCRSADRRCYLKKKLKKLGYDDSVLTLEKLNLLLLLKKENNIDKYDVLISKFGSVLND